MLNISPKNKNDYINEAKKVKKHINYYRIDTSHFKKQGWSKGRTFYNNKDKLYKYESGEIKINSDALRKFLFKYEFKKPICEKCGNSEWNGLPIPTQLHHVDANSKNNKLENLQILCPNCHAQTDSYRNKRGKTRHRIEDSIILDLIDKSTSITQICKKSGLCIAKANFDRIRNLIEKSGKKLKQKELIIKDFINKKIIQASLPHIVNAVNEKKFSNKLHTRKVIRPSKEELESLIKQNPMTKVGKMFNVSDQAVRKWCRDYSIFLPPMRGYWRKKACNKLATIFI